MRQLSEKTKLKQHRGTGRGSSYIPFCKPTDFNSLGTTTFLTDWIIGRQVHLLSMGEKSYYYLLRYDPHIADVREQYPLELEKTVSIAHQNGFRHPKNNSTHMTTDFLVTYRDGHYEAHSLKTSRNILSSRRVCEKLYIEKCYWESIGIPFLLVFKEDLDTAYTDNIEDCAIFHDPSDVTDDYSLIKYLIIHHRLDIDLQKHHLDYQELIKEHRKELDLYWNNKKLLPH